MSNVIAHGVDIIPLEKVQDVWERHGDRFLERLYAPSEREYCLSFRHPLERLAGRFAAKEAILKVLGTGLRGGLNWTDLEITNDKLGRPHVALHGAAADLAKEQGIGQILISISHGGGVAMASAIGVS